MASNTPSPLEVTLRTSNFPQTGSWSMVDILKSTIQMPISMLQRFAASRVQPYTMLVAEAMGMTFRMSRQGRNNLDMAQSKLHALRTLGAGLEIGFGVEDITRIMAKREGGAAILALCAALRECYPEDFAVEILLEYARITKAPGSSMPSNMEWRALLDVCAGTLATSTFPAQAEVFLSLAGRERSKIGSDQTHTRVRKMSSPESIAAALKAMADVSFARIEHATISGGSDIGWLAAVADWVIGLRIAMVVDNATDDPLYRNCNNGETVQLQFRCTTNVTVPAGSSQAKTVDTPEAEPHGHDQELHDAEHTGMNTALIADSVRTTSKTYRVALEDVPQLFGGVSDKDKFMAVSGRLEWKHALQRAFFPTFDRLMNEKSEALGIILGCVARILQAIVMAEGKERDSFTWYTKYCDASFGIGFIDSITSWFPELEPLRHLMAEQICNSWSDAEEGYKAQGIAISLHCGCADCGPPEHRAQRIFGHFTMNNAGWNCEWRLVETIMYLGYLLADTTLDTEMLLPTRRGLELAYRRQEGYSAQQTLFDGLVGSIEGTDYLVPLLELFTGRETLTGRSRLSAIWSNGVTAFLNLLTDVNERGINSASCICVIPGKISFEGISYPFMEDDMSKDALDRSDAENLQLFKKIAGGQHELKVKSLHVREGYAGLRSALHLSNGSPERPVLNTTVLPSCVGRLIADCRAPIHCKHHARSASSTPPANLQILHDKKEVTILTARSNSQFLAAVTPAINMQLFYIIQKECQDCCLRMVAKSQQPGPSAFYAPLQTSQK